AATNEQNNALLLTDDDIESFERSTTPATNNTSPTHLTTISSSVNKSALFCSFVAALSNSSSLTLSNPRAVNDEPIKFLTS
ncbi:unnamed protein product, partial [Rotaria sp. Silwood1]